MTNNKAEKSFNFWATCIITFCFVTCIFFLSFLEGCENKTEKKEEKINYPVFVLATEKKSGYLIVKDATGNYQRIYSDTLVIKYKAGDTIKAK